MAVGKSAPIPVEAGIGALLFDCDGTLIDSMPVHMHAWEEAVVQAGAVFDYDFFFARRGMPEEAIASQYNAVLAAPLDPAAVVRAKHALFRKRIAEIRPFPIVVDVMNRYRGRLPMAVVSGGTRENILLELDTAGIRGYFGTIVAADDGLKAKPSPDMFVEAARRLGVHPSVCQVFEDGDLGLQAARVAGMVAVDVRPYVDAGTALK